MSVGQLTPNEFNYLTTTSPIPSGTGSWTIAGWFKVNSLSGGSSAATFFQLLTNSGNWWIGADATTGDVYIWDDNANASSIIDTVNDGDWVYVALSRNGAVLTGYLSKNGSALSSVIHSTSASFSFGSTIRALRDSNVNSSGMHVCYVRLWDTECSQSELEAEMVSAVAIKQTSLLSDSALPNTTTLGAWTIEGSLTNAVDSPYVIIESPPTIDIDPNSRAANVNGIAEFYCHGISNGGTGGSYQWELNAGSGWVNVGTNSTNYTRTGIVAGDNGIQVRCTYTDSAGSDTSAIATLTVLTLWPSLSAYSELAISEIFFEKAILVKVWNGSSFIDGTVKYWTGTAWNDPIAIKQYNGSTWVS